MPPPSPIPGRRASDRADVLTAIDRALAGAGSFADLADGSIAALADALGSASRLAIYLEEGGRLVLQGQAGHAEVVHEIGGERGPYTASFAVADRPGLIVVEPTAPEPAWLEGVLPEVASRLGAAAERLSPRSRDGSDATRLSRVFVRIASQPDVGRLLELAARSVGDLLASEAVHCYLRSPPDRLEKTVVWRRRAGSGGWLSAGAADQLAAEAGWTTAVSPHEGSEVVLLPIRGGGEVVGLLAAVVGATGPDEGSLEAAGLIVSHAATALANLLRYDAIIAASLTDALTGLPNHRRFHEDGGGLIDACQASGTGFALVVADLDDFKDLNDRRGHVAGDDALRLVGAMLRRGMRPDDRAYRLGGEEFALLLPATTKGNARTVCRRLQRGLAAVDLAGWRLTQSMGVAAYPEDGETLRDLLAAADAALYEAKRLGKDRITLADDRLSARRTQGETMDRRGRRSFEQMRHLQSLAARLAGVRTPATLATAVLEELVLALPHDAAAFHLLDREALVRIDGSDDTEPVQVVTAALGARAVGVGRSFLVDDAALEWPDLNARGLRGALAAPLLADAKVVGAIVLLDRSASRYDRDDQRLLDVIAHVCGLAAENLRLLRNASSEDLAEALDDPAVLAALDRQALERLADAVAALLGSDRTA